MHGGDSLFGRMSSTTHVYRDSGLDSELDHKAYKVTEKLSESINTIANEPSVAFYRIQEHVRKTLPQLVEQKHEVEEVQQLVQGACFDTEYAGNAVKGMQKSVVHFQNIQELLKNAMFMKQQIDYDEARKRQGRAAAAGGNGRPEGQNGGKAEEGSDTNMDDSAVSTDSSLVASAHMCTNTEDSSEVCAVKTGEQTTEGDAQQEKGAAGTENTLEKTGATEGEDTLEEKDIAEKDDAHQQKDAPDIEDKEQKDIPDTEDKEQKDIPVPDTEDKAQKDIPDTKDKAQKDIPVPDTEDKEQKDIPVPDIEDKAQKDIPDTEDKEETDNKGGNRGKGKDATETEQTQNTNTEADPESSTDTVKS